MATIPIETDIVRGCPTLLIDMTKYGNSLANSLTIASHTHNDLNFQLSISKPDLYLMNLNSRNHQERQCPHCHIPYSKYARDSPDESLNTNKIKASKEIICSRSIISSTEPDLSTPIQEN